MRGDFTRAINLPRHHFEFLAEWEVVGIQQAELVGSIRRPDHGLGEILGTLAALRPVSGGNDLHAGFFSGLQHQRDFLRSVGGKAIQRHHAPQTEMTFEIAEVAEQVGQAAAHGIRVGTMQ